MSPTDVFLSYADEDRARAALLADALQNRGISVWWDRQIPPGQSFDEVIDAALTAATCVVVLWSSRSVTSDWVKAEAADGAQRKVLVPALLELVRIPLGFRRLQAADLVQWTGQPTPGFESVVAAIAALVSQRVGLTSSTEPPAVPLPPHPDQPPPAVLTANGNPAHQPLLFQEKSIAWLFGSGWPAWWRISLRLAVPGFTLALTSALLQISSMPGAEGGGTVNVGFLFAWNWSLMFTVVLPILFTGFSWLNQYTGGAIDRLERSAIIRLQASAATARGPAATDPAFKRLLGESIASKTPLLIASCVAIACLLSYLDVLDLTSGYYYCLEKWDRARGACDYMFREEDWSVAFHAPQWRKVTVSAYPEVGISANLAFVVAAYALQGVAIFFGFFWLAKVWMFLFLLGHSLEKNDSEFLLVPLDGDPQRRLGLAPLGFIYNLFVWLIVVFQLYVVGHRLQEIVRGTGHSIASYLFTVISHAGDSAAWASIEFYAFTKSDLGTWLLILGLMLPMIAICWLPMWTMRRYVERRKQEVTEAYAQAEYLSRRAGSETEARQWRAKVETLEHSSVWPNGDQTALRLLILMAVLWLGAIAPPALVLLVLVVLVPEAKKVFGRLLPGHPPA